MSKLVEPEIVDVETIEFDDDIEEIIISDYSGEEDEEPGQSNSHNVINSELKISSIVSCSGLEFRDSGVEEVSVKAANRNESLDQESDSQYDTFSLIDNDSSLDGDSTEDDQQHMRHALLERKRRNALHALYLELKAAMTPLSRLNTKQKWSKIEVLTTACEIISKLTIEERKLQYSAELCLQSNYRLKRKLKRMIKKKRKLSVDSREGPKPGKVVASRASV